jgi:hypothetical protein
MIKITAYGGGVYPRRNSGNGENYEEERIFHFQDGYILSEKTPIQVVLGKAGT